MTTGTICLVIAWRENPELFVCRIDSPETILHPDDVFESAPLHEATFFEDVGLAETTLASLPQPERFQLEWVQLTLVNRR